ncbi:MAG: hypothetical protein N4A50_08095 [Vallitalea sp.]|jgi:TRAP-type mannitol/chloroaromatic compound transport system permease small subunit|nr:hypothetical protein [Vallitalea sp.]
MNNLKDFFTLGKLSVSYIIHKIFHLGIIFIAYRAYLFGRVVYLTCTYEKQIRHIQGRDMYSYTSVMKNNTPLAVLGFIVFFIVVVFMWKFVCELLVKVFSYFEYKLED